MLKDFGRYQTTVDANLAEEGGIRTHDRVAPIPLFEFADVLKNYNDLTLNHFRNFSLFALCLPK